MDVDPCIFGKTTGFQTRGILYSVERMVVNVRRACIFHTSDKSCRTDMQVAEQFATLSDNQPEEHRVLSWTKRKGI